MEKVLDASIAKLHAMHGWMGPWMNPWIDGSISAHLPSASTSGLAIDIVSSSGSGQLGNPLLLEINLLIIPSDDRDVVTHHVPPFSALCLDLSFSSNARISVPSLAPWRSRDPTRTQWRRWLLERCPRPTYD